MSEAEPEEQRSPEEGLALAATHTAGGEESGSGSNTTGQNSAETRPAPHVCVPRACSPRRTDADGYIGTDATGGVASIWSKRMAKLLRLQNGFQKSVSTLLGTWFVLVIITFYKM